MNYLTNPRSKKLVADFLIEIKEKLEESDGVAIHVGKRAKFEGWLKVELCSVLSKNHKVETEHYLGDEIKGNKTRIDLVVDDNWAIELKTANTNYPCPAIIQKTKPITKNLEGIHDDLERLKRLPEKYKIRSAICVVFPCSPIQEDTRLHNLNGWKEIENNVKASLPLKFKNGAEGIIYYLEV